MKRTLALTIMGMISLHAMLGNNGSEARTADPYTVNNRAAPASEQKNTRNKQEAESVETTASRPAPTATAPAYREVTGSVRKGDSLVSLLARHGVARPTAITLGQDLRKNGKLARSMQIGDDIKLVFGSDRKLLAFAYAVSDQRMILATSRGEDGFAVRSMAGTLANLHDAKIRELFPKLAQRPEVVQPVDKKIATVTKPVKEEVADKAAKGGKPGKGTNAALRVQSLVSKGSANLVEEKVRKGDGLAEVLARRSVSHETTLAVAKAAKPVYDLAAQLTPGKTLRLALDQDGDLMGLSYIVDPEHTFWLVRIDSNGEITAKGQDSFVPQLEKKDVDVRTTTVRGTIRSSLFEDGRRAGLSHTMLVKLAGLFEWDVDFAKDIQPGDRFKVVFEEGTVQGKKVNEGVILAAEFVNQGKVHRVVRFVNGNGDVAYYKPDGSSIRKMFIRAPVDFTRVSSGFSSSRLHPVFGFNRAHKGVDYAAPTGTPVRAAGDGVVEFVGPQGAFGNLILVRHNASYTTAYAHLSRFEPGIRVGSRVSQGNTIGRVGTTGVTTGPHLHYEVRIKGEQVNPLTVKSATADGIDRKVLAAFKKKTESLVALLDGSTAVASVASKGQTSKD